MYGLFKETNNYCSWFSWDGMDGHISNKSSYSIQENNYFKKEPERDHFQDWLDLKWTDGDPDFDPMRPL